MKIGINEEVIEMHEIRIYGVGYGGLNQLSSGLLQQIYQEPHLYARTLDHPIFSQWDYPGTIISFDEYYVKYPTFQQVYVAIVSELKNAAESQDVAYVVPGHPMVAEMTVKLLLMAETGNGSQYHLQIMGGQSFLDQVYTAFQVDPVDGCVVLDGTSLQEEQFTPYLHLIIMQVYDRMVASEVKLTLMEYYPDEYPVVIGTALGIAGEEQIQEVPLYQLDHHDLFNNLTCVYVPKSEEMGDRLRHFQQLRQIIAQLRSPEGCPWDQKQTHQSLRKYVLEEAYEVADAIDEEDPEHLQEELGDLLLQVMLHAQIGKETDEFSIYDVIETLNKKMIHRHPHVFGSKNVKDEHEVLQNWQELKEAERQREGEVSSLLNSVPVSIPAMQRAIALQKEAAKVGFDWAESEEIWKKIYEELLEVEDAKGESIERVEEELGDLFFALINYARFIKIDPEAALANANLKFTHRFQYIEHAIQQNGGSMKASNIEELEYYWQAAKQNEKEK